MRQAEVTSALRQKDIEKTLALEEIRNAEVKNTLFNSMENQSLSPVLFSQLSLRFNNPEDLRGSCMSV